MAVLIFNGCRRPNEESNNDYFDQYIFKEPHRLLAASSGNNDLYLCTVQRGYMNRGYIKLWRKTEDSGLLQMHSTFALFIHMLMKATYKPIRVGMVDLERGQLLTGRIKLAEAIGVSDRQIRTCLDKLHKLQIVTSKSTNHYTVYTIVNYNEYQDLDTQIDQPNDQQQTNNRPTTDQRATNNRPTTDQQPTTIQEANTLSIKEAKNKTVTPRKKRVDPNHDDSALQVACRETWGAYCNAYAIRYSTEPVRNAKVSSQIKLLVGRLGAQDAPFVADHYLHSNAAYYVSRGHSVDSLLADAEKLRTEWATGHTMTTTRARQIDQSQANMGAVAEAMKILKDRENAENS